MGLQDRGYYRERQRDRDRSNINRNLFRDYDKPTSPMHPLLRGVLSVLMTFVIASSVYGFYLFSHYKESIDFSKPELTKKLPDSVPIPAIVSTSKPLVYSPSNIVFHADLHNQYRGTLFVNDVAMPFLIDTGAAYTTVPTKMAYAARLPLGQAFQTSTANGIAIARKTYINSFKIGSTELRNLEAATTDNLDFVVVGMNILKLFHMTQDRNTLILSAYADELSVSENAATNTTDLTIIDNSAKEVPVHIAKKTWMKTVTCDANKHCKTSYR